MFEHILYVKPKYLAREEQGGGSESRVPAEILAREGNVYVLPFLAIPSPPLLSPLHSALSSLLPSGSLKSR